MRLTAGGTVATRCFGTVGYYAGGYPYDNANDEKFVSAGASKIVMRAGQHYAQFTVGTGNAYAHAGTANAAIEMWFGLIRPSWKVERRCNASTR
jgi:hypothetical protein